MWIQISPWTSSPELEAYIFMDDVGSCCTIVQILIFSL